MKKIPLKEYLKENHKLNAENPIDHNLLEKIPFFAEVFSDDRELWEMITKLAGSSGIAHIEDKSFKAGEKIVKTGSLDQMVFWVIEGMAEVLLKEGAKKRIIKNFTAGECFGELTIIKGQPRTADVTAGKDGARVLEFDWAITDRCFELKALFTEFLLNTIADKLQDTFGMPGKIITQAAKFLKDRDEKIKSLEDEILRLKTL